MKIIVEILATGIILIPTIITVYRLYKLPFTYYKI